METSFDDWQQRDLATAEAYNKGLKEVDKSARADFLSGVAAVLRVLIKDLPEEQATETQIQTTPVGQVPEEMRPELGKRILRGESTSDIPRVSTVKVRTEEGKKTVPLLKLHFLIDAGPDLLVKPAEYARALNLLNIASKFGADDFDKFNLGTRLTVKNLEFHPVAIHRSSKGTRFVNLSRQNSVSEYVKTSWSPLEKEPGIQDVDLEFELDELTQQLATQDKKSGAINLFLYAGSDSHYGLCHNRGKNEEIRSRVFVDYLGSPFLYISLRKDWIDDDRGFSVINEFGQPME
jgi:hypothetical protein